MSDIHGYEPPSASSVSQTLNLYDFFYGEGSYEKATRERKKMAKPKAGTRVEVTFKGTVADTDQLEEEGLVSDVDDGFMAVEEENGVLHLVWIEEGTVFKFLENYEDDTVYVDEYGDHYLYSARPSWLVGDEPGWWYKFGDSDKHDYDEPVRPLTRLGPSATAG